MAGGDGAPAGVGDGDDAPVVRLNARHQQGIGGIVRVAHPVAEAVGDLGGHQEHVGAADAGAALADLGLRARGHPVEAVAHAVRRDGQEALAAAVAQAVEATDLPVAMGHQRVAEAVGRRVGEAEGAPQHFLTALPGHVDEGAAPVVGG
jgi:hypothetical protein